jgi:hypothetical protein|tara:strand:- start:1278 stop:1523 length:246 start_codon:yes stop_codon:yes gene_type:complete
MDFVHIVVAGSLVVIGLQTIGYSFIKGTWLNAKLFTLPLTKLDVTAMTLMGLIPLSLGLGMLVSGADVLGVAGEVFEPSTI